MMLKNKVAVIYGAGGAIGGAGATFGPLSKGKRYLMLNYQPKEKGGD